MAVQPELKNKSKGINMAAAMLILVIGGLACVAVLQHLLEKRALALSTSKESQWVEEKGPAWHLQLDDVPEGMVLIGFKYGDRVYMDASELCQQPGFRAHADEDGRIEVKDREGVPLVMETPDITLPDNLAREIWTVLSAHQPPESRVFDTPYQWLNEAHAPANGACLFLGQGTRMKAPRKIYTNYAEPVIGLMGRGEMPDTRLQVHEEVIRVTSKNRLESLRKLPWLLAWLHQFSSNGAKQCGSSDGFMPSTVVLPMKVKILPNGQQAMHWLAATGCEQLDRWSLVMTNEDGTTSFITLNEPMGYSEYGPAKVWTIDIDGDGMPEFLIKAQYYKGSKYVLLRLNESEGGGYYLSEISASAYEGL
jgi:hypothetical protein